MFSLREMVTYIAFFSVAWFVLGLITSRYLPRPRLARSGGEGSSRRRGDGGGSSDLIELYVGNLPYDVSEKELHKTFKEYGAVASARIISNRFTGKSRGFGFVEMENRDEAGTAIRALNGKDMRGRKIVVNEAK